MMRAVQKLLQLNNLRLGFIAAFFIAFSPAHAQISHLELGAANYSAGHGQSPYRFAILDGELRSLIQNYGATGVIYLNDIDEGGLTLAVSHARLWLGDRGYSRIRVVPLPGDYTQIDLPFVKTANLNNPGSDQLPIPNVENYRDDLQSQYLERNRILVHELEQVALHSESGLKVTSYFYHPNYLALDEIKNLALESRWVETGLEAEEYIGPAGQTHLSSGLAPRIYYLRPSGCSYLFHRY